MQMLYERTNCDSDASDEEYSWVRAFQPADIEFLTSQPYTISIPSHNIIVVHAGIVPGVSLECQWPYDMTTMRGVVKDSDGNYTATVAKDAGSWAGWWFGPQHVYFGHNASRGLQRHLFAMCLDTGCVYGGHLTGASINSPNQQPVLYCIPAKQVYKVPDK